MKLTLSMDGWVTSRSPTEPAPGTMLSTPAGTPASRASSPNRSAEGSRPAPAWTTVLPMASWSDFQVASSRGKFQGVMAPTTPTGCSACRTPASLGGVTRWLVGEACVIIENIGDRWDLDLGGVVGLADLERLQARQRGVVDARDPPACASAPSRRQVAPSPIIKRAALSIAWFTSASPASGPRRSPLIGQVDAREGGAACGLDLLTTNRCSAIAGSPLGAGGARTLAPAAHRYTSYRRNAPTAEFSIVHHLAQQVDPEIPATESPRRSAIPSRTSSRPGRSAAADTSGSGNQLHAGVDIVRLGDLLFDHSDRLEGDRNAKS